MGVEEDPASLGRHQVSPLPRNRLCHHQLSVLPRSGSGSWGRGSVEEQFAGHSTWAEQGPACSQVHASQRSPGPAAFSVLGACSLG